MLSLNLGQALGIDLVKEFCLFVCGHKPFTQILLIVCPRPHISGKIRLSDLIGRMLPVKNSSGLVKPYNAEG